MMKKQVLKIFLIMTLAVLSSSALYGLVFAAGMPPGLGGELNTNPANPPICRESSYGSGCYGFFDATNITTPAGWAVQIWSSEGHTGWTSGGNLSLKVFVPTSDLVGGGPVWANLFAVDSTGENSVSWDNTAIWPSNVCRISSYNPKSAESPSSFNIEVEWDVEWADGSIEFPKPITSKSVSEPAGVGGVVEYKVSPPVGYNCFDVLSCGSFGCWKVQINYTPAGQNLSINKSGTGQGTVKSNDSSIDCGATCSASYNYNDVVALTASPSAGSVFAGWSGDADCSDGNVTMNGDKICTATFNKVSLPPQKSLNVIKTGQGKVQSVPVGIDCGGDCSEDYPLGTAVTLTATPAPDRIFTGWTAGGCDSSTRNPNGSGGTCNVILNNSRTVTANFAVDPNFREF